MDVDRARGSAEIGYWIAAPARGRGVTVRAIVLLRDWAVSGARADDARHPAPPGQRALAHRRRARGLPVDGRAGDDQADAAGTAAGVPRAPLACRAAASDVPTASSAHVTGSSRNAAYSHVCTTSATKPAATTARYGSPRAPGEQPRERRGEQREVEREADDPLLGGDRERDRVRGRDGVAALAEALLEVGLARTRPSPSRSAAGRARGRPRRGSARSGRTSRRRATPRRRGRAAARTGRRARRRARR